MPQQVVYVEGGSVAVNGRSVDITVSYNATDSTVTGLGLRVHYDSGALTLADISNVLPNDLIFTNNTPSADTSDFDNNAATDSYISLAWASLFGNWPVSVPVELLTASFDIAESVESTVIGFSTSSSAAGFEFIADPLSVTVSAPMIAAEISVDENIGENHLIATATSGLEGVTYSLTDTTVYSGAGSNTQSQGSEISIPELVADTQQIFVSASTISEDANQATVVVSYNADDNTLTGLGLRIHFDSQALSLANITDIFPGYLFANSTPTADTADYDNNAATDSFVDVAWAALFGDWTATDLPDNLLTLVFDSSSEVTETSLGFSSSSHASGYNFQGYAHNLTLTPEVTNSQLSIDAATGEVTLAANPDYEDQNQYSFAALATDTAGNTVEQAVTLAVNNLDEIAPSITSGDTATAINENTGADQVIYTATSDDSADISGGVSYSLIDTTAYSGAESESQGSEISIPELLADTQQVFVSASTVSEETNQATVVVSYNADDNTLPGLGLRVHFDSQVLNPADITHVLASDLIFANSIPTADTADYDNNAATDSFVDVAWASLYGNWSNTGLPDELLTLVFDISAQVTETPIGLSSSSSAAGFNFAGYGHNLTLVSEPQPISSQLSIDTVTGAVSLAADPDYEAQDQYNFTVVATDTAGNASQQAVTLSINDIDEVAPIITSGDTAAVINENSGSAQIIYTATSNDSSATYSLAAGTDGALSIDAVTGAVSLAADPDYEAQDQYNFTVVATDAAGNAGQQAVTLSINDIDEVAPIITSGDTAAAINENSGSAQIIYTATSNDSSATYSLAVDTDAALSIDAATGAVSLATDPDYEIQDQYNFTVVATDTAGNTSQQAVTLAVSDLDEIAPTFTSQATVSVVEDTGAGQIVYVAQVDDSADISSGVTYSLSADSDVALSINAATGQVSLVDNPVFTSQSGYNFTVIATDAAGNASQQAVILSVVDIDQEAPVFTSANTANIDENAGGGQVIYTATSEDQTVVSYSLSAGTDAALSINAATGAVSLATDPDYETQSEYSFTVVATDTAGNTSQQAVTLVVNNLDEIAPVITSSATAAIDENSGADQVIYTATSDDSSAIYSLAVGTDAVLSIDAVTGAVSLATDPDYEIQNQYNFTVVATDTAGNAGQQAVTLAVNNLDEIAPIITSGDTATAINENTGADQVIYTATSDDSADISGGVSYSLIDTTAYSGAGSESQGSEISIPELLADTQQVFVSASTVSEDASQATVVVSYNADDNTLTGLGLRIHYHSNALTVADLTDVLASDLIFANSTPTADTADYDNNAATDSFVDVAWASLFGGWPSAVPTELATITFDIAAGVTETPIGFSSSSNTVGFNFAGYGHNLTLISEPQPISSQISIEATTGAVSLAADPDYETQSEYSFTVMATDAAGNAGQQAVTLAVNDLDEIAPSITSGDVATAINENSGSAQIIYTATSNDSSATYSLAVDTDAALSIDAATGQVTLAANPDYEIQNQYSFTVIATDAAGNSSQQAATLSINNIDEVAPTITSGDTAAAIDENTGADQIIYTATTDDSADISGGVSYSLIDTTAYSGAGSESQGSEISIPELLADTQQIFVSASTVSEDASQATVVVSYNADDSTTTGLGLRVHFDSSALSVASLTNVFSESNIFANSTPTADIADYDNNAATDSFVDVAWASLFGSWPSAVPTDLATIIFDIAEGATGSSAINFSTSSVAAGFAFAGQSHNLVIGAEAGSESEPVESQLSINAATGAVSLAADPDYETQPEYSFTVVATDAAGNAGQQAVTLSVNDLDDTAPTASEDAASTDSDDAAPTASEDAAPADSDDAAPTDSGGAASTDSENTAPAITSGDTLTAIDENSGAGQVIYTVASNHSGPVTYDLLSLVNLQNGAIEQRFVENIDGSITLQLFVDDSVSGDYIEGLQNFDLVITYNDAEITAPQISFSSETALTAVEETVTGEIKVAGIFFPDLLNIIDNPIAELTFNLEQDIASAEFGVSDVLLGDALSLTDSIARYYINRGFSIDSDTGAVTLIDNPDHEMQSTYRFTVTATDAHGNLTPTHTVTLDINDIDDAAPTITSSDTVNTIDENSGAGQVIYTATADDTGDDISSSIAFSLTENSDSALTIDSQTGEVILNANPDYEMQNQYSFTVVATDAAGNISQGLTLTLDLNNLDEVAPSITSGATALAIDENSGAGQLIYTATADDTDYNGIEPVITYSLSDNAAGVFSIDVNTGQVALLVDPDYETQSEYSFTVVATDAVGNQSDAKTVTLSINDINDFALAGKVYHWGSQALLENVAVTMHHQESGAEIAAMTSDSDGGFAIHDLAFDKVAVSVERDLQTEDLGRFITSADALAALKMAVGINPNAMDETGLQQRPVSPYQLIAADVNRSGRVTSADALEILKMAVKMPNVTPREWLFVAESQDFWDETAGADALSINRSSVAWDSDAVDASLTELAEINFVGVMLGDVNNTWSPLEGSQTVERSHFEALEDQGVAPLYQWGLAPQSADDGFMLITSGGGSEIVIIAPDTSQDNNEVSTVVDFESAVDTIDASAALQAIGYTGISSPTDAVSDLMVHQFTDATADIIDLINGNDGTLDNAFGGYFDDAGNSLTLFVDADSSAGAVAMQSYQIALSEDSSVDDHDLSIALAAFIA